MFYISQLQNQYFNAFKKSQNITDLFAWFSVYVWESLEFAAQEPNETSKVDERTLTNDFVSCIAKLIKIDEIPLPVRLFHSTKEKVNGSDIEIVVKLAKDKNLLFACQAKRLYVEASQKNIQNAMFKSMGHGKENHEPQIELLVKFANKIKAFPLYLLYNYTEKDIPLDSEYSFKESFGCSMISADYLKKKFYKQQDLEKLRFKDLHPPAKPIISFSKLQGLESLKYFWGNLDSMGSVDFHSDEAILNQNRSYSNDKWIELNPPINIPQNRFVHSIDFNRILATENERDSDWSFNPKFRIYITNEFIFYRKNNFNI